MSQNVNSMTRNYLEKKCAWLYLGKKFVCLFVCVCVCVCVCTVVLSFIKLRSILELSNGFSEIFII